MSTAARRAMKKPVSGSDTFFSTRGKTILAKTVRACDVRARDRLKPTGPSRSAFRLATTISAPVRIARSCSSGMTSGGCCKSASITQTQRPRPMAIPSTTAPLSPLRRCSGRATTETGNGKSPADWRMTPAVPSLLSSMNNTSNDFPRSARSSADRSGLMFPSSFRVGTMMVSSTDS